MKRISLLAVLIAGVLASSLFATERPDPYGLDGREVVVRVYDNWENNPGEFMELNAWLDQRMIMLDSNDIPESAFIVVVGEDQHDEVLKKRLGDRIWAELYKEGLRIELRGGGASREQLRFQDAMGKPLSNANVEILLYAKDLGKDSRVFVREVTVGKSGRFVAPPVIGSLNRLYLVVTHPDNYGLILIDPVGFNWYKPTRKYLAEKPAYPVKMPWVCRESKAYERSICGVVLDEADNPVSGASVDCTEAYRQDDDYMFLGCFYMPGCKFLTDEQGQFRIYVPLRNGDHKSEESFRLESKAPIQIDPPSMSGLAPYVGTIVKESECTTVRITDYGHFHTFLFEDQNVPIVDLKRLSDISVEVERRDKALLKYRYDDLKEGWFLPSGTYKAYADWKSEKFEFEPLQVTKDSSEELVFKPKIKKSIGSLIYSGRVVHGITGVSLSGVFILTPSGSRFPRTGKSVAEITQEQWSVLHSLDAHPYPDDERLRVLRKMFSFEKIVRTDRDGHFEIHSGPGREVPTILALEEHYLDIKQGTKSLKPDPNGCVLLPVIPLFPAARVAIEPSITDKEGNVFCIWVIDMDDYPAWVGRPQDIERYESTYNLKSQPDDPFGVHANEIIELEPESSHVEYNSYLSLSYMLFDFVRKIGLSLLGMPFTIQPEYRPALTTDKLAEGKRGDNLMQMGKSFAIEVNHDLTEMDEVFGEPEEDSERIRTLMELKLTEGCLTHLDWLTKNTAQSIYVPAGVKLKLEWSIHPNYRNRWAVPATIAKDIYLRQGETLDLGKQQFERTVKIFVKVVDSAGRAVKGVPVEIWFKGIQMMHAHDTDENGRFAYIIHPHTKGKFYVALREHAGSFGQTIPFEVGGEGDDGREFILHLSDEMLKHLFKQGKDKL